MNSGFTTMLFRVLNGLSLGVLSIITGSILSNNAQSSEAVFVGRMGGLEVQVQGDKALFRNNELIHNSNPLSLAMNNKGVQKIEIEPDKIEIYTYKNNLPDTIYFPLLIEPTPTASGIQSIDQTRGFQLLNDSVISLATTVIDKTIVLPTPTLNYLPTEYNPKTITHSEIELYQETQHTFYATASIPMLPPVSSVASGGDYIDLDFEAPDTIRVYPKGKDNSSESGFFEQIIRKVADSPEKKNDNDRQQEKQTTTSSTQSDATNSESTTTTTTNSSTGAEAASTSTLRSEASASDEDADETLKKPLSEQFNSYHSIENSSNQKVLDAIRALIEENDEHDLPWVVLEKIHGCNYSFWTDGTVVRVGRRNDWVGDDEKFFNHRPVYEQYREMILDMYRKFCKEGDILNVTGELYGKSIQKQIFYQDNIKFAAFDIFVNKQKIDYNTFKQWTLATGIPTVIELKMCDSFEDALSYNPVFKSLHSQTADIAEGVVIKPVEPKFLKYHQPVILKIKNSNFDETNSKKALPKTKKVQHISEENQILLASLLAKVTENRLDSVTSKSGELTKKNNNKIRGEFLQDILDEYKRENELTAKDKVNDVKQWKLLIGELFKAINELIRPKTYQ
ncbi:RNA ligase family protein [Endozoicomonas sp. ISHI1]|uniref:RNA ligase family protein n=2 Tax=Endozoicomonas TaxID=305899 RepID=UPI0021494933|nr:RNA ligase family protein [Endozoicomonas sp. ISHI1]